MSKGIATNYTTGQRVKVRNSGIGTVSTLEQIKTGSRGRPKTSVGVLLENGTAATVGLADISPA